MRLFYNAEDIEQELNRAIESKKLSNWFWVYFLHENTPVPSLEVATEFLFHNRRRLRSIYTDSDGLIRLIQQRLSDCLIPDESVKYAPNMSAKKVHAKVYFFGDKKALAKCNKWEAFIGSYNVQFEKQDDCIRIAAPVYFETLARLTSGEDPEMLEMFAEYFDDLKKGIDSKRRRQFRIRMLPEPEDYRNYIEKHDKRVIESLNKSKYSEYRLRDWQLFKDKYQPAKVVTNTVLGERYGLSRERVRQIIERMKRILITTGFTFLDSEITEE
jgi:hypothetical protein